MTHNDLRYEFGPYQLNPSKHLLTRAGAGIPLTPETFDSESKDLLEIQGEHTRHLSGGRGKGGAPKLRRVSLCLKKLMTAALVRSESHETYEQQ
jgi:hypothetical protein